MRLIVYKFGPIEKIDLEILDYTILIGRQAAGKSTISKLVYYFLNLRDEIYNFIIESLQEGQFTDVNRRIETLVRKRFIDFFGPTIHDMNLEITFNYNDEMSINIVADKQDRKFINTKVSDQLGGLIAEIFRQNSEKFQRDYSKVKLFMSSKTNYNDIEIEKIQKDIRKRINTLFGFSYELLFIPAGRSILSTLSDQLQNIHPHLLDFTMRSFIGKIVLTNSFFRKTIDEIIKEKEILENRNIRKPAVVKAKKMIDKIIKGTYVYDENGGKIIVNNNKYVKINFTSSGQQESLWIVLSLFLVVLDNVDAMVFIEEPEAHLFPEGQKDIIEYASLVRNLIGTRYFITTHSPYILSALNNCLYAEKLKRNGKDIRNIYDPDLCFSKNRFQSFLIENGFLADIMDKELEIINVEKIDLCSREINRIYGLLEDLEYMK